MAEPAIRADRRFLTFWIGPQLYALPADEVSEVIRVPPVAKVPQGPAGLMGLGNLRGSVLPIASGRGLLGQPEHEPSRAIVLTGPAPVALAVDRVAGLVGIGAEQIVTDTAGLAQHPGERLRGAFPAGETAEAVKILDVWPLLEAAFVRAPRPARPAGAIADRGSPVRAATPSTASERLVTFEVGGQEFGLPLHDVREIVSPPARLATVPRAESIVLGVSAYRNTLLPLFSLQGLLGLPGAPQTGDRAKVLVIAIGAAIAGLLVDRVRAIVLAEPELIEPTPAVLAARSVGESRIKAIYRGEGGRRLISILSKDQLFREDVVQQVASQAGAAEDASGQTGNAEADELRFLVFRLGPEEFGLPIEAVDEVARVPAQVTRVPNTPAFLEGVINLRGEVLPVVDQRRRFDLPPTPNLEARRLVVVRTAHQRAGLIVDSVSEVLRSSSAAIDPAPDLTGESGRLVRGVVNLQATHRLVLLLDPAELLTRAERGLLEAFQTDRRPAAS